MLISLLLILLVTAGGMSLTYLLRGEKPMMWRLAAGNIVGSAFLGTLLFIVTCIAGLSATIAAVCVVISVLPVLLFINSTTRFTLKHEWIVAKGKLQGVGAKRFRAFAYYAFFFLVFWFFFGRAMFELPDGIYTGGSNNLGDLPFHLGAIFSFTDANNFSPQNPSWAGAKFSYPFIADLLTACFMKLGANVQDAMFWQNFTWAFSLLVILERFALRVTTSRLAARIVPALLFFSGGLGIVWFARDLWVSNRGLWDFLWQLPQDYTIGDRFRWGNSMVVLFITQRSLLLGMPLTVLVISWLWKVFTTENTESTEKEEKNNRSPLFPFSLFPALLLGLLAGTLPLIHLHSLATLFLITATLFVMQPAKWKTWMTFGIGVAIIAIPEIAWSMSGSATESSKFFEWHLGWDKRDHNIVYFWLTNTAIAIPLIAAGIWVRMRTKSGDTRMSIFGAKADAYILFYIPFALIFVIANVVKLAPWEWDNIKLLIYWYVGSLPLMAIALTWAWEKRAAWKFASAAAFALMISAGALDVWRTASGQIKIRVFDRDAIQVAEQLKQRTDPKAVFLNAPTYNSAIVLSGRLSLMRYSGHLSSHGIDYLPREEDVKRIYEGGGVADILLRKYNIDYVLISPEERGAMRANESYFKKFSIVAESGQYRVYKVK